MFSPRILLGASFVLLLTAAPLRALIDRNNDGLSDVWAALYHPTKGATVDEDGDGFTNAQEALAGTDPLDAASRFAATPQTDAAGNLVLRWRGAWGKRYLVESSADLKTWTALPALHVGRGQELSVVVRAAGAAAEARRYWRVVVADVDTDGDGMTSAEEIELGSDPTVADATLGTPRVYGAEYFVSPNGSDTNAGTKAAPFRTLEKAKAAVRTRIAAGVPAGGIAVWLRGGVYERSMTLELTAADSGTSAANSVDWRGYPGEDVQLLGGRRIAASAFSVVTSASPIWSRLDVSARGKVLQIDLKPWLGLTAQSTEAEKAAAYGVLAISDPLYPVRRTGSALELFIDRRPMQLGRWPDAGYSDPAQGVNDEVVQVYGQTTPAVAGTYRKIGVVDGVSLFQREGLVAYVVPGATEPEQLQYYLHRRTWEHNSVRHVAWFLETKTSGYPVDTGSAMRPWWSAYRADGTFGDLVAYTKAGAAGTLRLDDPSRPRNGFTLVDTPASAEKSETRFTYHGDRPARWTAAPDLWVHGYFRYSYFDHHRAASVDSSSRTITFATSSTFGIAAGQPWYAYNLLEEITQPGEYYLDRASGLLYLWPPAGFAAASEVVVSLLETPLLRVADASWVTLRDFIAEAARKDLVSVSGGDSVGLEQLRLGNNGGTGVAITGGRNHRVSRCVLRDTGLGSVSLSGGDRAALAAANSRVQDCDLSGFGRIGFCYQPAVKLVGCGMTARNNRLSQAHHSAILWEGNDHAIERNDISDVCRTANDAGAIYAGNEWASRGTAIRENYLHDISSVLGGWVHGIYLDDCLSGVRVERNIVVDVVGNAIMHGGGRDHVLENNLMVRCSRGLYADGRGVAWTEKYGPDNWKHLLTKLVTLGYQRDIAETAWDWPTRFPECATIPNDWATVLAEHHWLRPEGCVFVRNAGWDNAGWIEGVLVSAAKDGAGNLLNPALATDYYAQIADNLADVDPLFVDEAAGDLRLRDDSPVRAILGWEEIPFGRIGVRE
ncbi:MAG TPA: right-handed parallel beta-helix repeat-containing protein [Opitutaceae bacterium]|nr:right-handed parallel beta-helix repeat-containing protein [Opitutaceae bacterium]